MESRINTDVLPEIDWLDWLQRWDAQQEGYVPKREARFRVMFDALAELLPASFVALDLACGPGSISQRLLTRFPDARAIAADIDPVMLAIGRGALGTVDGRLRWIEADLASPDWLEALGEPQVDAVLSTTALDWLEPEPLARLYHDLGRLLRSITTCLCLSRPLLHEIGLWITSAQADRYEQTWLLDASI